jgi:hypothetical protein
MKGQSFLIISIIFIIILALIKANISFQEFQEDKSFGIEFENTKEEMVRSVEFSVYEKENISRNLESFAEFARDSFKRRALNLNSLILEAIVENDKLNVSVKNLLGNEIIFLNISFSYDNSFREFENIKDGEKVTTTFSFSNGNYTLKIFYKTPFSQESEEFLIETEVGKSKFIVFLDISLENEKAKLRDKIFKSYELPA